jgi:peptidoglycan/LPS O-acetylase OafA/YrhL
MAASYVVAFHAVIGFYGGELSGPWRLMRRLFAFGHEAVAVFIVLSGYCLMLPVLRSSPQRLAVRLPEFIRRRAFRILPPYYAALVFSLALLACIPLLRARTGTTWDDSLPGLAAGPVASHLLVVHNWLPAWGVQINGPLWSVATEWQIYFFFPLLLLPVWRRFGMLGGIAGAALVGYAPLAIWPGPANLAIPWYLVLFTFGMAAAAIGFSEQPLERKLREGLPWWCISTGSWIFCALFGVTAGRLWFSHKPLTDLAVGFATASLLIQLTRRTIAGKPSRLLRLLESRPLVGLGHFSYSLYLTHLPVLALCYFGLKSLGLRAHVGAATLLIAGGAASLAMAWAFYLAVERRFLLYPREARPVVVKTSANE